MSKSNSCDHVFQQSDDLTQESLMEYGLKSKKRRNRDSFYLYACRKMLFPSPKKLAGILLKAVMQKTSETYFEWRSAPTFHRRLDRANGHRCPLVLQLPVIVGHLIKLLLGQKAICRNTHLFHLHVHRFPSRNSRMWLGTLEAEPAAILRRPRQASLIPDPTPKPTTTGFYV